MVYEFIEICLQRNQEENDFKTNKKQSNIKIPIKYLVFI